MKNGKKSKKILFCISGLFLTTLGFLLVPAILNKYSNELYKSKLKNEKIDIENMGPEIIKK